MALSQEERRIVFAALRWIRICHQTGYMGRRNFIVPSDADAHHSSLLERLLRGDEPFAEPPPLSGAYPDTKKAEQLGMERDPRLGAS